MVFASIIIPTCNRVEDLQRCLEALCPQVLNDGSIEVIVTDDGRTEGSKAMMEEHFPSFLWVRGPRRGPAANRNFGVSLAAGRWLIFLDDDCLPASDYLAAYLRRLRDVKTETGVMFIGPTVRMEGSLTLLWEAPHNPRCLSAISCNLVMHRDDFVRVGKFDERYPVAAFEDTEFEARCRCHQLSIEAVQGAVVNHPLRKRPPAGKLAARWEGNAIFAFDQGASFWNVLIRLPWHALRVIQARFRKQAWCSDTLRAVPVFALEWLFVLTRTPGWALKWSRQPRSRFWSAWVRPNGPVPKFGF